MGEIARLTRVVTDRAWTVRVLVVNEAPKVLAAGAADPRLFQRDTIGVPRAVVGDADPVRT